MSPEIRSSAIYPDTIDSFHSSSASCKMTNPKNLDPDVWGPTYWFFLHTIAYSYPDHVNQVTKRKYYDFLQNLPLFIPNPKMGDRFAAMLDKHPVGPYLDSRESFIRWVNFIHNKYNVLLGKEEVSLQESIELFLEKYRSKPVRFTERSNIWRHMTYLGAITVILILIYVTYR